MELESEISKVNDLQLQNDSSGRYDGTHKTQLLFIPNQHNEHMNEYIMFDDYKSSVRRLYSECSTYRKLFKTTN